ncbi:VOC family protein [Streptomyces alkaliphilus]|uniref:VOC family protein n=1 Tax=Streptomyces alkaliphilus TaxID=1472722 RepID=UPI0015F9CEF7
MRGGVVHRLRRAQAQRHRVQRPDRVHPEGLVLAFQRVENHRPPRWADPARPQQFHLDPEVADLDRAQEEVLALGASLLDESDEQRSWRVFADPAGHRFCLVRH